ncbi:MAG: hypothetical protein F6K26_45510 [Moorea sp. SIO2I5]|nr:hypothetical protein [Moorena sp. SIO2I5]
MAKRPRYANNLQPNNLNLQPSTFNQTTFNLQPSTKQPSTKQPSTKQPWPKGHATRTTFNNISNTKISWFIPRLPLNIATNTRLLIRIHWLRP